MGWIIIIDIRTLFKIIDFGGIVLIVLCGLSYSIGTIFYSIEKKYYHTLWHLFVILGSVFHYFFIIFYVL